MWSIFLGLAFQVVYAQSDSGCTRDPLYTSLSANGFKYCTDILKGSCGQGYSTPTQYMTYNTTRISTLVGKSEIVNLIGTKLMI